MSSSRRSLVASCALAALAAACGGEAPTGTDDGGGGPGPASVAVEPSSATFTALDAERDFSANVERGDGTSLPDSAATWTTTNRPVATVDGRGVVTSAAAGVTRIVASFEGAADTAEVTVEQRTSRITVTPPRDSVPGNGGTVELSAEPVDRNGNPVNDAVVDWSSTDSMVAAVDGEGVVTGGALGRAGIVAESDGASDTATVVVFDPPGNDPPRAVIRQPGDGSVHGRNDTVGFSGSATDFEDGDLTGSALAWSSDVDGNLGSGEQTSSSALSTGDHTIRLVATDSQGLADTASITLEILEGPNLRVKRLDVAPRGLLDSEVAEVGAVVVNEGTSAAGAFDWELRVDGTVRGSGRVAAGVSAGDSARIPTQTGLGPFTTGRHDVALELDTGSDVDEGDEGDNTATDRLHSYPAGFSIELAFVSSIDSTERAVFRQAARRWEEIVTSDLPDIPFSQPENFDSCVQGAGDRSSPVDDLLIYVRTDSIDGVLGVLGRAGPCFVRTTSGGAIVSSVVGGMFFDEADLDRLEGSGQLEETVLHEMGHVLGIGTLWPAQGLLEGEGTSDPTYTGPAAREGFFQVGGDQFDGDPVPVANTGGAGTRDAHWRESVFDDELMTGFLNSGENPLSVVSVAGLRDQFLAVDESRADAYDLPSPSGLRAPSPAVDLGDDLLRAPLFGIDPSGRVRRIDRDRRFRP